MLNLTRRTMLRVVPASVASLAIPAAVALEAPAPVDDRVRAAVEALKAVAQEAYPELGHLRAMLQAVLVHTEVPPPPAIEWTGPGVYEFELLGLRPLRRPTAFLDVAGDLPNSGWFEWRHYFKGRFQGRKQRVRRDGIRIIRKLEDLSGTKA